MAFKKTSDHKAKQGLKYLLHRNLVREDPPRSLDILHASELTKEDTEFCPRERGLLWRDGDNRKPEFLGTALSVTFQVGRWYEHQVRNNWLREFAMGDWECQKCNNIVQFQTEPDECENCGSSGKLSDYIEPRAYSPIYDASCGVDMMLWRNETLTPVEIKTIDKDYFKALEAPFSEHRRRTQFYLDLLSHSTWMDFDVKVNTDEAILLYCCKGFGFGDNYAGRQGVSDAKFSPFKEFIVKRGDPKLLKPIYNKALAVKDYKETGILPPRICPTFGCSRAKKCTVRDACFV